MAVQPTVQEAQANVGHPILRELLVLLVQVGLPIAERYLAAFLASKGIVLPPVQIPTAPAPAPDAGSAPANKE